MALVISLQILLKSSFIHSFFKTLLSKTGDILSCFGEVFILSYREPFPSKLLLFSSKLKFISTESFKTSLPVSFKPAIWIFKLEFILT